MCIRDSTNYSLDVTDNQRIGGYLDIGSSANKGTAPISQSATKDTQLSVYQTWTDNAVVYKPIEVIATTGVITGAAGTALIDLKNGSDSVFNVDKDGNVAIKEGSTYGLSDNAFYITLTVKAASATASNEVGIDSTGPFTFNDVYEYVGSSQGNATTIQYGFKTDTDIGSFKTSGSLTGGGMQFTNFNARSILLFINGVLQEPYIEYNFDGARLYLNTEPPLNTKIFIRALAN